MFDELPTLPPGATPSGSAFLWQPEGESAAVSIGYDVIDRLGAAVMEGFGRVPKRGAEIGGLLLGTVEQGARPMVRIEDFVAVPSEHRWGPSYQLSEKDQQGFDDALGAAAPSPDRSIHAIGYFRSHTREPFQLAPEDHALLDSRFPQPHAVCLLIRPYPTRVSDAAFLFRENGRQNGHFAAQPPAVVLPFRRRELGGGKPERRRPNGARPVAAPPVVSVPSAATPLSPPPEPDRIPAPSFGGLVPDETAPQVAARRRGGEAPQARRWIAPAFAVAMLLLGLLAGAQVAVRFLRPSPVVPQTQAAPPSLLPLRLAIQTANGKLLLRWSLSPVLERDALRGVLLVVDGLNEKRIDLTRDDLLQGALRYRNAAPEGRLRLEIELPGQNTVSEAAVWLPDRPPPVER